MLNRILDALASRAGLALTLGPLVALSLWAGLVFQIGISDLETQQRAFSERQLRNGFTALSDVQRLNLAALDLAQEDEVTPEQDAAFRAAIDFLYVLTEGFEQRADGAGGSSAAQSALADLKRMISIAEQAISSGYADPTGVAQSLLAASDAARISLVGYLDEMRALEDGVLAAQTGVARRQTRALWGTLCLLTIVGIASILLLRREVLGRRGRQQAERRVQYLAFYDDLTGLPNRVQFQDRLTEDLASGRPLAVLFLDLDDFKSINDTSGHAAGDAVLQAVGELIGAAAHAEGGFAARLGGDEFAAVLPGDDLKHLGGMSEQLLAAVSEPIPFEGEMLTVGLSIGLATNTQVAAHLPATFDQMCRVTDFALYAAKGAGRNRLALYDTSLERKYLERRALIEALPSALGAGELEVYLQPKVRLPSEEIYGFEALVRWNRDRRIVPPGDFIMIAEESGMVTEIDAFMLMEAAHLVAAWNAQHGIDYGVSVNLSALHFSNPRIVETVRQAVLAANLPPALMTLEITETVELRDWQTARSTIEALQALGCRIAIDDFGTGFSSLAYLRLVGADELKIDKSLVREVAHSDEARFIIDAVLDIGENLGMDVIVEGVETSGQARVLHEIGVRFAQGYLFGRPLPAEAALTDALTRRVLAARGASDGAARAS